MAKTDDRASHYVFVEDEDIFAEDEKRLASRRKNVCTISPNVSVTKSISYSQSKRPNPVASRFQQDPAVVRRDLNKLRRAVKLLSTIPPPPSVTNPQYSLHNIVNLSNHHNFSSDWSSKWRPGLREEDLGHDVYLNTNNYVEELEHIRQRLTQRFVSNETATHLTYNHSHLSEQDKELQRRNGLLKSSASHANNLSNRKSFYNQFSTSSVRTFVYDNKKSGYNKNNCESKIGSKSSNAYRALFNSPKKHGCTAQLICNTQPQSSASSAYYSMPPSNYSIPSAASTASSSSSSSHVPSSRSSLSGVSSRSEKLVSLVSKAVSDGGNKRICQTTYKSEEYLISEKPVKKPKKLSQLHGKKMLWAVETLLKSEGVVNTDAEYKTLYSNIYRETTQVWLKYIEKRENGKYKDSSTGTSDLMVNVAKKLLPGVEQKLGIFCSAIKSRKEAPRKAEGVPVAAFNRTPNQSSEKFSPVIPPVGDSVKKKELNESSSSNIIEDDVFSPEMLGVSNLCEGIDAVISSLDDLPPDPGDKSTATNEKSLNSLSIIDPLTITIPEATLAINNESQALQSSIAVSQPSVDLPVIDLSIKADVPREIVPTIDPSGSAPVDAKDEKLSSQSPCEDITNPQAVLNQENNKDTPPKEISFEKVPSGDLSSVEEPSPVKVINCLQKPEDVKCTSKNVDENLKVPICIVKLERCKYLKRGSDSSKTPPEEFYVVNSQSARGAVSTPDYSLDEDSGSNKKASESKSPSTRRRSKRKRASDVSSTENTPTSALPKSRTNKRLCSTSDLNESENSTSHLRRSSRKKLPLDREGQELNAENKPDCMAASEPLRSEDCNNFNPIDAGEGSSKQIISQPIEGVASKLEGATSVALDGEPSSSGVRDSSPKNIDKENDSSMKNISEVDNQNWSPVLKLTRFSKDLWSSELKKKRIRRKKENSENSPVSVPFLDLEGPFKYRLCKRARPGEFVSAIIKGQRYIESLKKLVNRKVITKDCVLVRTVDEGIELRIPMELLKKERIFLGPNVYQDMIIDIVEDAICKLEGFDSDINFSGFTIHDVNQAAMTSCLMERTLNLIQQHGEVVKPLFNMYKYAIVKQSPHNIQDFYKIFVEILKTSLFLRKTMVEDDTIQVRPLKAESPKKIQLEISIPVRLIGKNSRFKENILKDLTPVYNIISC